MKQWYEKHRKLVLGVVLVLALLVTMFGAKVEYNETQQDVSFTIGTQAQAAGVADYACDGVDDNVQFQAAINALPATGGKLVVLGGNYSFSATVTRLIDNITIQGVGRGTYIAYDAASAIFTFGGNNWKVQDLRTDAGGITVGATTGWMWTNVTVNATYYAYRSPYGQSVFNDTTVASLTDSGLTSTRIPIAGVGGLLGDDADLTFNGSYLDTPVGRSATITVAAFDATALEKAQADYVCGAADADTVIETALTAAVASGRGSVTLIGDTFTGAGDIDAISDVNVYGTGAEIIIASDSEVNGITFNNTTNTTWRDILIRRTGNTAGLAFAVMWYGGTTDETTVAIDITAYNDVTSLASGGAAWGFLGTAHPTIIRPVGYSAATNHSQACAISGSLGNDGTLYNAYPTIYDFYMVSRGTGSTDNNGVDVEGTDGTAEGITLTKPMLFGGTGIGAQGNVHGYGISFKWGSNVYGRDLLGISGGGNNSAGICFEGSTTAFVEDSTGRGVGLNDNVYGVKHIAGSRATTNNVSGEIDVNLNGASLYIDANSFPTINGGNYNFVRHQKIFNYDDLNNGRFRPFDTYPYQLYSLSVYVVNATGGANIDIGTSIGGNEVVNNVSIAGAGFVYPTIVLAQVAAAGYLYITPSVAIADGDIHIYYSVVKNTGTSYALQIPPAGSYTGWYEINSAHFEGASAGYVFAVPSANGEIKNSTIVSLTTKVYPDISIYTINFYNCVIKNVDLSAGYPTLPVNHNTRFIGYLLRNSGTASVLNTTTSIAVAHGLSGTPSRIMITPRENPTNAVAFWWVDTVGAANFTINVNADPGASHLDFDWIAWVGEGN